jgi:hypothetical protein
MDLHQSLCDDHRRLDALFEAVLDGGEHPDLAEHEAAAGSFWRREALRQRIKRTDDIR